MERQSTQVSPPGPSAMATADQPFEGPYTRPKLGEPEESMLTMNIFPTTFVQRTFVRPSERTERSAAVQPGDPRCGKITADSRPADPMISSPENPSPFCQRSRVRPSAPEAIAVAFQYRDGSPDGLLLDHRPEASSVPTESRSALQLSTRLPPPGAAATSSGPLAISRPKMP